MRKLIYLFPFLFVMCSNEKIYKIESKVLELTVTKDAENQKVKVEGRVKGGSEHESFVVGNSLLSCNQRSDQSPVISENEGIIEIVRELVCDSLKTSCRLTERYAFNEDGSLNCKITIQGNEDQYWDTSIESKLLYHNKSNFWTAWAAPNYDEKNLDGELLQAITLHDYDSTRNTYYGWRDPLVSVPFADIEYFYGAPAFDDKDAKVGFIPFQENLISVPIACILDPQTKKGISLVLSPADPIFDMTMETKADGSVTFKRLFNRICKGNSIGFNYDIVLHEDDWRPGLAWMRDHYKEYFYPKNSRAFDLDGTGAYSESDFYDVKIDVEKMRKMSFKVNWQASFDFPYMGMFIPPVTDKNQNWKRFNHGSTSINNMVRSVKNYKENGFSVLSYFNVTEFGANIKFPPQLPDKLLPEQERWTDANQMLYTEFKDAILPQTKASLQNTEYKDYDGAVPYITWGYGIGMDCAEPVYQRFLLGQLRRHMTELPEAAGICIDRLDWIRMYNERADDGKSCYKGRKTRSQVSSWKEISDSISAVVHANNKVVLVNNHSKRIDILKNVDGIFDEFTYAGTALNLTAFLCINKPALGWTASSANVTSVGGDSFMQKYLYMGVFPMCPFPGNDHSISPSPEADQYYLDYGPLMKLMEGAEWVLKPHVISTKEGEAKVNLFKIPSGYSIPVVHAAKDIVLVRLKGIDIGKITSAEVYHPGADAPVLIPVTAHGDEYELSVPVKRKCAMVHLKLAK